MGLNEKIDKVMSLWPFTGEAIEKRYMEKILNIEDPFSSFQVELKDDVPMFSHIDLNIDYSNNNIKGEDTSDKIEIQEDLTPGTEILEEINNLEEIYKNFTNEEDNK